MNNQSTLQKLALTIVALLAGVIVGILTASCTPAHDAVEPARMSSGITHFDNLSTTDLAVLDDLTVTDDISADAISAADLAASDDLTVADDFTLSGLAILDDTARTVTTATFTPTVSFYHADASAAVTWTLPACSSSGQLLLIYGDDNYTITIADSNLRSTDGNAVTVAQYDVVLLVCVDTEWVHVAKSANS